MKRVLLTGAAGFIGSYILEKLLSETDWYIIATDGLTYAADASRFSEIIKSEHRSRVTIVYHDLRAPFTEAALKAIGEINVIIACASNSHVDKSIERPQNFIESNVSIALTLLEFARTQANLTHFNLVSTDECFGQAPEGYSHKEWDAHIPSNPYAASKAAQEDIAISYWRTYGVPVLITCTMNNFGSRQHEEKAIPKFVKAIQASETVEVHGQKAFEDEEYYETGYFISGSRVWLHASNHADAILWLIKNTSPARYPNADRPDKYNVAGQNDITTLEIAKKIGDILNLAPKLEYLDIYSNSARPGHDLRYSLDGSKLKALGWKPPVTFDESFEETVKSLAAKFKK